MSDTSESSRSEMGDISEDILIHILSFVSATDLLKNCCLVCHQWSDLISGHTIWKTKCQRDGCVVPPYVFERIPKNYYRDIYRRNPYGRNLLKNPFGEEGLKFLPDPASYNDWCDVEDFPEKADSSSEHDDDDPEEAEVLPHGSREPSSGKALYPANYGDDDDDDDDDVGDFHFKKRFKYWIIDSDDGDGWGFEYVPNGADPVPEEAGGHSCFVTSFELCQKHQVIDLLKEGLRKEILDEVPKDIAVGEWHAARFDCGSWYALKVELQDAEHSTIDIFEYGPVTEEQWAGKKWSKAEHVFTDCPPGIRYIVFEHSGQDTQWWAGHYGSKMTGGYVKFLWK